MRTTPRNVEDVVNLQALGAAALNALVTVAGSGGFA